MFELLFYSGIHCIDAKDMIRRIEETSSISKIIQIEVVETVKEAIPECKWDAND